MAKDLKIPVTHLFAWSDSVIVLGWLNNSTSRWKVFVSNHVTQILDVIPSSQWRHVPTEENPADHASRGLLPNEILHCHLWWHGPAWLEQPPSAWPLPIASYQTSLLPEARVQVAATLQSDSPAVSLWYHFSSRPHLVRVFFWCCRFFKNAQLKKEKRNLSPLITTEEIDETSIRLLYLSQLESFPDTYHTLKEGKPVTSPKSLCALKPFLHKDGLIRVGGRLELADAPFDSKHPILLHRKCHFTELLVRDQHITSLHVGPTTLLSLLSEHYFVIGARRLVKAISQRCVTCQRSYLRTATQMMGQLPETRIKPSPPFSVTGIDFAGPFTTKRGKPRKPNRLKSYVCLFVCFATKCIHLELCSDL